MRKLRTLPVALTIAGSDSGGGAGIQADLKTFAALSVHGTSVVTCLTAQNPRAVLGIQAARPKIVRQQMEAIFAELRPAAVKTGLLFSRDIIEVVVDFFARGKRPPLIVDPVMVATSGARLLNPSAVKSIQERLLPLAALVTPNVPEAEALTGYSIHGPEDLRTAARLIRKTFGCAVLVKGGHLIDTEKAIDIFFDGKAELMLSAPFIKGIATHGTGCTYSAAITAYCARGCALPTAVQLAKEYITQAIARSVRVRGHAILNHG